MKYTNEQLAKAKTAKTAEELFELAKAEGVEMTEEEAKNVFAMTREATGELSDDELENVAGGGCHTKDGRLVITALYWCAMFTCNKCHAHTISVGNCSICGNPLYCCNCDYCVYEKGLWLCEHRENRSDTYAN